MCQDRCLGEGCLEGFECLGVIGAPGEWGVLAGEENQGYDNVGEPHNESVIKVGQTQEHLDCLEVSRGQPDTDCISLGGIHGDASGGDHKTQGLNLLCMKQALLQFGVQVILTKALQYTSDMDQMIF